MNEQAPTWLPHAREQLTAISRLRQNWDSYGAPVIPPARIAQARNLVQSIADHRAPPPSLVPTPDGSIQLEWHTHGIELEVLLLPESSLQVAFEDLRREFPEYEVVLSDDVTPLIEHVRRLGARVRAGQDG